MRRLKKLTFLGLGAVLALGPVLGQTTNLISGEVIESTNWSGICLVEGQVLVRTGVVVRIEAGARMMMGSGAAIEVRGQLLADGSEEEPILFTRVSAGSRWEQIRFVRSEDSRFRHCTFEFADSAGTHLDYYDNDCNESTPAPVRNYHEAIVVLASDVEFDGCLFRNLPDDGGTGEGDAIAVVSDDPLMPGPATAVIRNSRFVGIGQGIHTRYSYVLVEGCTFTGHHGDNDDVDLYGESEPPPMIRNNVFLNPAHDDMINPTKCSAVIVGNVISGGDDHGLVLRDRCAPIVMNNLITDCSSAGIAVQNQCDALIANNTIVDCGRGIRFFDHTGRWGPPYCLNPGSGRATVINTIIWNCPTPMELTDSPYPQDLGSHVTIQHSTIQGGQSALSVSANSTVQWGAGNLTRDPLLTGEHRLSGESPAIDSGTDPATVAAILAVLAGLDREGMPRPLDGNGDGQPGWDMGASEFLLAQADSNSDGIPDGWCREHGLNPLDGSVADGDADADGPSNLEEWVADTNPTNALSFLRIDSIWRTGSEILVQLTTSSNRVYGLFRAGEVSEPAGGWQPVSGQEARVGTGGLLELSDAEVGAAGFYRVQARLP